MKALTSPASHVKPVSHSAFDRWGRTAYRRRRLILVIALLVAVVGGVWGTTIFAKAQTAGGFAVMRLAGDANWWAPAPLRRFYARHGIHEDDGPAPGAVQAPAPEPVGT